MVTELTDSFTRLESEIAKEKGDFALFALFLREDVPDRWDLIISAPWATADRKAALEYVINRIRSQLGAPVLTDLSRIVFVDPQDVAVQNLNRAIHVEHGSVEVKDSNFFGLPVKHAYIITSKRPNAPVAR
jgi:hypothetical protein